MNNDELSLIRSTGAAGQRQNAPSPERPFDEPWQARAFALAVVTVERLGLPWDAFRDRLKAAITANAERPYWESWLTALEDLTRSVYGISRHGEISRTQNRGG